MGQRKRSKDTESHGPPILNTIEASAVSDDDIIFPVLYEGEPITRDRSKELTSTTPNPKGNVPNLVYRSSQAPSKKSNNGWKHVICSPNDLTKKDWHERNLFRIETGQDGYILVQFCQNDVHQDIRDYVGDLLEHHTPVGETGHERGKMVASDSSEAPPKQKECMIAFDNLLLNPSDDRGFRDAHFRRDYTKTLLKMNKCGTVIKLVKEHPSKGEMQISVLPTYAASESLNNSLHIDDNDVSRCYAVFYQQQKRIGISFLVFPRYSVVIQCNRSPVLVSWDRRHQQHCIINCHDGIRGLFGACNQSVKPYNGWNKRRKVARKPQSKDEKCELKKEEK